MSNLFEVARRAGVSHMTVSRYFNQPDLLSPTTREKVRLAVEALQFVPNAAARSLVVRNTSTIAMLVADISNLFYTTLVRGVEAECRKAGYMLLVGNTDEEREQELAYVTRFVSRRVDGLLLTPGVNSSESINKLGQHDVPVVLVDRTYPGFAADVVRGDSFDGGLKLTQHLLEQGFQRIAFVGGTLGVSSLEQRVSAYRAALSAAGQKPMICGSDYTIEGGRAATRELLASDDRPDAILAANNHVAAGALVALREAGIRVPDQMGVGCFDDIEIASMIYPFLTVAAQPAYEIGRIAMAMLLERIEGYDGPPRERVLPVELIVRESSLRRNQA